jgi:CubicO group peptidase (beta-lactamase class C family)
LITEITESQYPDRATGDVIAGLSLDRLARIDAWAQRYVDEGRIAGGLTVVARGGEVAYFQPHGAMDLERKRPTQRDTIYRIYSMSKPIACVALLMLFEEGLFQLDRPVERYIPSWKNLRVYQSGRYPDIVTTAPERPMLVGDLFSHTSGLSYGFDPANAPVDAAYKQLGVAAGRRGTLQQMVDRLADAPLEYSPGTRWKYSLAIDVIGYLVQEISGLPFDQFLQERIFGPLGMVDTGFNVSDAQADRFAANYRRTPQAMLELGDDPATSEYRTPATFFSGGGGLVSTAGDYLRFCQMLANGGELDGVRILGPRTIDLMSLNHLPDGKDLTDLAVASFSETQNAGNGFGLGVAVHVDQVKSKQLCSVGTYYWGGAASTIFWIDPIEDLVVIFMTQLMPSGTYDFRRQLHSLVYSSIVD